MNSTIQCLYRIPELRQGLQQLPPETQPAGAFHPSAKRLAEGAKDLFAVSFCQQTLHTRKMSSVRLRISLVSIRLLSVGLLNAWLKVEGLCQRSES